MNKELRINLFIVSFFVLSMVGVAMYLHTEVELMNNQPKYEDFTMNTTKETITQEQEVIITPKIELKTMIEEETNE